MAAAAEAHRTGQINGAIIHVFLLAFMYDDKGSTVYFQLRMNSEFKLNMEI